MQTMLLASTNKVSSAIHCDFDVFSFSFKIQISINSRFSKSKLLVGPNSSWANKRVTVQKKLQVSSLETICIIFLTRLAQQSQDILVCRLQYRIYILYFSTRHYESKLPKKMARFLKLLSIFLRTVTGKQHVVLEITYVRSGRSVTGIIYYFFLFPSRKEKNVPHTTNSI